MRQKRDTLQSGFSLIEVLMVLIILVVVGSLVGGIFFTSLRASHKSSIITIVRSNGNNIISQMEKEISYSQSFNGVSTDGTTYIKDCTSIAPGTTFSYVQVMTFKQTSITYSCSGSTINRNGSSLLDTSKVSVVPSSCSFTCTQNSLYSTPTIGVQFSLKQTNTSGLSEDQSTIPFQTSIDFRNGNR